MCPGHGASVLSVVIYMQPLLWVMSVQSCYKTTLLNGAIKIPNLCVRVRAGALKSGSRAIV